MNWLIKIDKFHTSHPVWTANCYFVLELLIFAIFLPYEIYYIGIGASILLWLIIVWVMGSK